MAQEIELKAQVRKEKTSRGELALNRKDGTLPAVVYGAAKQPYGVWVSAGELDRALHKAHSANVLFSLQVAGEKGGDKKETVLLKDIQRDPVRGVPVHVDFFRIKLTDKVEVEIPIRVTGEAKGVKVQGGILEHLLRALRVSTLPTQIPESVIVDVTNLEIGHSVLVRDLQVPQGVEVLTEASHVVVNIVVPAKEEVAAVVTPEAGAVAAQPEVIAKGKKDLTPEEAAEAAKTQSAKAQPAKAEAAPTKK